MNEIGWYLSRATGIVSVILLTATFVLGALTSGRAVPIGVPVWVRTTLHRILSLIMVVFVLAHVSTTVAETYVDIGWISALVPFASNYDPVWVGLGTLAFDLLLAMTITSLLRNRLSVRAWRTVHWAAYAVWPLALIHGLGTSTSDGALMLGVTLACAAAGASAVAWRVTRTVADTRQRQLVAAQGWR